MLQSRQRLPFTRPLTLAQFEALEILERKDLKCYRFGFAVSPAARGFHRHTIEGLFARGYAEFRREPFTRAQITREGRAALAARRRAPATEAA